MSISPVAPARRALPACLPALPVLLVLAGRGGDGTGPSVTEDRVVAEVVVGPADPSVPDAGTNNSTLRSGISTDRPYRARPPASPGPLSPAAGRSRRRLRDGRRRRSPGSLLG
jgi:hypothetical protein